MYVLVAGGAGYIGSHISKMLTKRGYSVIVLDNLSHGYKEAVKYGEFIEGDISDKVLVDSIFKKYSISAVMHFCAFIEVGESVVDPEKYYINNVSNTITLIEMMRKNNVNNFIFSSTAATYGNPVKIPIEEDDLKQPINPYGMSKLMIENVLDDYDKAYGFKSIRFRYFNASGADPECEIGERHQPETHLIPLILQAASGSRDSIKIYGTDYPTDDKTAVRDYVHVNDLADAHIRGLEYLLKTGTTNYFNLGSGTGYSVKEVIDMVKKCTGKEFKVIETERRAGDPPFLVAQSEKAKEILGWGVTYSLEDIVKTAWNWHLSQSK
ncbi:MAG: UDP-glucose 4-epimerase GalE [Spirochaetes bacterium GWF1_31_7]|nr:MAG: UDP-glucose 4-epimerase GalE [Spirochaetes bacterium GWE1_32_154]OHD46145.1 MAG: UDP-glucose 4-epimerase GalE [Spirochaetes bacterium GWE2_31_10]OHD49886.1 MAG: UDP-glucose 4-epimerase GalE [Spirochaetes bacterium GWF1_31_7]HBD96285.1 UDP-glucose 4-epimerase GalE [Spirochaetia bacterium]HBI37741.1 UDP-glucose 4-epimerase GalE [Spirochaetia bacterium]